jgi:hypothetical protein
MGASVKGSTVKLGSNPVNSQGQIDLSRRATCRDRTLQACATLCSCSLRKFRKGSCPNLYKAERHGQIGCASPADPTLTLSCCHRLVFLLCCCDSRVTIGELTCP